ncbi:AraC family transcriptional regulator [Sulfurospirillum sp. 1612]|uniref:AraC family transcriptional regulator n=1 Tax=Sulfurospirillum sp. 1612 TaxID=3094835 RepID=UPI002F95793A
MKEITYSKSSFSNKAFDTHSHDNFSISLITEGACTFSKATTCYTAFKNDIRIINPHESHAILRSTWTHINIVPQRAFIQAMVPCENIKFQSIIQDQKAIALFYLLYASFCDTDDKMAMEMAALEFFSYLIEHYLEVNILDDEHPLPRQWLKNACSYMQAHALSKEIRLDAMTQELGISKYHFIREFKKHMNISPYRYLQNIKINKARAMIDGGVQFADIAQECGFYDQSHMIKVYKQFYGHSPSQVKHPFAK